MSLIYSGVEFSFSSAGNVSFSATRMAIVEVYAGPESSLQGFYSQQRLYFCLPVPLRFRVGLFSRRPLNVLVVSRCINGGFFDVRHADTTR